MKRKDLEIIHSIIRIRKMILVDNEHVMIHTQNGRLYPKLLTNLNINKMMWKYRNNEDLEHQDSSNSSNSCTTHIITDMKKIENGYLCSATVTTHISK